MICVDMTRLKLEEVKLNAERYEFVRRLNLQQFADIYKQSVAGVGRFDDLVDQAIIKRKAQS